MWLLLVIFFFKQKTAYEMRISDWSSDVCSSDLSADREVAVHALARETLYPYIVAIQSFPKVAVAPLLVVWLGYGLLPKIAIGGLLRSEERRVGKECVSTFRSRWSPSPSKKKVTTNTVQYLD